MLWVAFTNVSLSVSGLAGFRRHSLLSARLLFYFLVGLQSASCPIRVEGKKKRSHLSAERSSPNAHGIFQTRDIHGRGQIGFVSVVHE
jgi:hypothetical protein